MTVARGNELAGEIPARAGTSPPIPDFYTSVRGYNRQQVDRYVEQLVEALVQARDRIRRVEAEQGALANELEEAFVEVQRLTSLSSIDLDELARLGRCLHDAAHAVTRLQRAHEQLGPVYSFPALEAEAAERQGPGRDSGAGYIDGGDVVQRYIANGPTGNGPTGNGYSDNGRAGNDALSDANAGGDLLQAELDSVPFEAWATAQVLRQLRRNHRRGLHEVAAALGVPPFYLWQVEQGECFPSDDLVRRVARYYNVEISVLRRAVRVLGRPALEVEEARS